jgi:hypothetical protein
MARPGRSQTLMKETESRSEIPVDPFGYEWIESPGHPGNYFYRNPLPVPLPDIARLEESGFFAYEAKSAFHYQQELMAIAGERRVAPMFFRTNCILRADRDNPHDRNAVEILIAGRRVGYIAQADNQRLALELRAAGVDGDVQCLAEIRGAAVGPFAKPGGFRLNLDLSFPIKTLLASR